MTRNELIQVIEKDIGELTADLQARKQALTLLRSAGHPPRTGPIVYGNKTAKVKKQGGALVAGVIVQARGLIKGWLENAGAEGLTTATLAELLRAANVPITGHTVHNALRALNPVKVFGKNGTPGRYVLQQ